jgi:predicted nuclease of predicted toxin-antitoxin system
MGSAEGNGMGAPRAAQAIRYFFDEHVRAAVAQYLRAHGVDVMTTREAGRANQGIEDADQLTFATTAQRVMVSSDNHFLNPRTVPQLLTGQHAGIVRLKYDASTTIGDHARYLRYIAVTETMETLEGQIRYFERVPLGLFADD